MFNVIIHILFTFFILPFSFSHLLLFLFSLLFVFYDFILFLLTYELLLLTISVANWRHTAHIFISLVTFTYSLSLVLFLMRSLLLSLSLSIHKISHFFQLFLRFSYHSLSSNNIIPPCAQNVRIYDDSILPFLTSITMIFTRIFNSSFPLY